jgi:hypothetical protein
MSVTLQNSTNALTANGQLATVTSSGKSSFVEKIKAFFASIAHFFETANQPLQPAPFASKQVVVKKEGGGDEDLVCCLCKLFCLCLVCCTEDDRR